MALTLADLYYRPPGSKRGFASAKIQAEVSDPTTRWCAAAPVRQLCLSGRERPNLRHDFGYVSTGQLAQLAFELAFERLTAVWDWRRLMRKSIPRCAKSFVIVEQ
jgi:hypothetical protein